MPKQPGFFEGTEMPTAGWWEALWPDPAGVLRAVGMTPGMDVIDLCSGDGWFTLPIAQMARSVVAVDIDPALLEVTRARLAEQGVTNGTMVPGDAYAIGELVPGPVDFVFLANAFHGVPDQSRLAAAVITVLKPAAQFAIINWHQRPREETIVLGEPRGPRTQLRMSAEQVIAAVTPTGLKLKEIIELPPYHYGALFTL